MVDTIMMRTTNTTTTNGTSGSATSSTPTTSPSKNSHDTLTDQTQIVDGLLRQQPQIIQTGSGSGVSGLNLTGGNVPNLGDFDYANLLQALHTLSNVNSVSLTPLNPFNLMMGGAGADITTRPLTIKEEEPSPSSSTSPSSTATAISLPLPNEPEYKPRNVREKVYADGYIMSFDKKSCCGTKYFWRCERKNDCNARMHSDINTREIVRKLHPHNHDKPSVEELAFYEQDFSQLDPNFCWPVKHINRSYMQRKLSRASHCSVPAPQSLLPDPMEVDSKAMLQAALNAAAMASASPQKTPNTNTNAQVAVTNGQKRAQGSPKSFVRLSKSPKTMKKEVEEPSSSTSSDHQLMSQEDFRLTCELTKKLMDLMKPRTEIGVTWNGDDGALLIFLSNDNGAEENVFFPVVVMNRDEKSLITALEGFTGKRCEGQIAMSFSHRVNVLVHEALISNWPHGKLLLVNTDSASLWRLTPVDAYGEILNSM
uniref:FLYWCH-type domain-containing protein n=1 Tax=Caenorhabditis japonica TaxID=281687 RepID=A0A8R1I1N9_CAEJA